MARVKPIASVRGRNMAKHGPAAINVARPGTNAGKDGGSGSTQVLTPALA